MNVTESAPTGEEVRIAEIEAMAIGMKALGKDYTKYNHTSARSNETTSYPGPIVGENEHFLVQKVSPLNTVGHAKHDLPTIPKMGSQVRISYSKHQVKITDDMKHNRKRAHTI